MTMDNSLGALLVLWILVFLALYTITKHFLHKFQNLPPSPFPCLPILGHAYLIRRPIQRSLAKISKRHGPVLLLKFGARPVLVVSSPSLAEDCLAKNDKAFASRPLLFIGKIFAYNHSSIVFAPYGELFRKLKRIASLEILSMNRVKMMSSIRSDEVKSLLCRLLHNQNGGVVDMRKEFFYLTLNIMMRMMTGERYYGEDVPDGKEPTKFRTIHEESFLLNGATHIRDFSPWIRPFWSENKVKKCQKKRDEFMQRFVADHKRRMENNCSGPEKTLIEVLLSLQKADPKFYTDGVIKGTIINLLFAGIDPTSNVTEWALTLLLNHPEALRNARNEIDSRIGHDRFLEEEDLPELPYLGSVIKETTRLYPPAPVLIPHESTEECMVGGYRVPPGTMLFVNVWAIQNDPTIWEDPKEFRPERFEGLSSGRDGFKLLPFGYGRRGCTGEGLALRVIGLTLGSLIQCFEWETVDGEMVDVSEGSYGVNIPKAQPLVAVCRPRPAALNLLSQL